MAEGEIKQKTDGIAATLTDVPRPTCAPCLSENIEVESKWYCVQCKEYLCEECVRFHQKVTVTKSHTIRDAEYAMPTDVCEANEEGLSVKMGSRICQIHPGQSVKQFCIAHKVLCCSMCLEDDHNSCESEQISTVSKGYAQSAEFSELTGKVTGLNRDANDIIGNKHKKAKLDVERFLDGSKERVRCVAETIMSSYSNTTAFKLRETIIDCLNSSEEELQSILTDIQHIQVYLDSTTDYEEELFKIANRENSNLRRFEDFITSCNEKLPTSWILSFSPDYETILSKMREPETNNNHCTTCETTDGVELLYH